MALVLRLRWALATASTAAPLLCSSASHARPLPLAPPSAFPAAPLLRAPWQLLPSGAARFRSTAVAAVWSRLQGRCLPPLSASPSPSHSPSPWSSCPPPPPPLELVLAIAAGSPPPKAAPLPPGRPDLGLLPCRAAVSPWS
ncbi:hypothetical protein PAHAL_6G160800 [Panicum hallii]|uniref:Uncharacterized protein n=1 Tax=Panicum hallii TaxID=206008 RepID=A0A2S3I1N7_9POAL|nr:hypothetical protein PAHAL_6G160800 [Panicum hallii]